MKNKLLVTAIALFVMGGVLNAQEKYKELQTKDGVTFKYKWKNEKKSQKQSPLELIIKLKNTNDYKANVTFTVDYFYNTLRKASSEPQSFCVKSNKVFIGKVKKSGFDRAGLSNEQMLSDEFILELSGIKVTKSPNCKQKEKL